MKGLARAPNLPSQVTRTISDEILAGRYRVGDRLPTEFRRNSLVVRGGPVNARAGPLHAAA